MRDVPHHVRGPREHRDRGPRDQAGAPPVQHTARLCALRVCLSVSALSDLRRLDRRSVRSAQDAVSLRRHLGGGHHPDRARRHSRDIVSRARAARRGRGRDVPCCDARDADVDPTRPPRLRAGDHARIRAVRQRGDAADCRVAHRARDLAWIVRRARLRQPAVGADVDLVFPRQSRGALERHARGAGAAAEPWRRDSTRAAPARAVGSACAPDAARDDRVLLLRLDAVAVPELAAVVFPERIPTRSPAIGALRVGRVLCRRRR